MDALLSEFKKMIEARGIDSFWISRTKGQLRLRAETIAQVLLAAFAKGVIGNDGFVLREFGSGIWFVDVGVSFGSVLHLIELKVLKAGKFTGASQLATYMETEERKKGWLVIIDARKRQSATIPAKVRTSTGSIAVIVVNVNPAPPSG